MRAQRVVELRAGAQAHEEDDAHVVVPVLADGERLEHLGDLLDLAVDLRGADAHAAGVERGVGAAVDDHAAVLGPFGEVAVAPDAGEALEIGGVVFGAVGIVPEADRHRRNGRVQTSSPLPEGSGRPSSSKTSIAMPRPGPWISPRQTGSVGTPRTKQETMSVPPEIEARWTSRLIAS